MSQMNAGPNPPGAKPGQMTAVMRAMAQASGPKVLRIGLVQGGRIIEERVIKQRTTVTVGPSEKAMFVVPAPNVPAQFKLFELVGNDYALNFLDGMTGRIALQTGITDIGALKGQAKRVGNAYQVKLTEEARGKVIIGDTTFLFQFVAPPPPQPRPQLPLAVKGGLANQIDWNLTVIAAFSFLLHFGLVGAMYSDWMDPVVNDELGVQGLIDLQKSIPTPPVVEEQKPKDDSKTEKKEAAKEKAEAPKAKAEAGKSNQPAPKISEARAAALAEKLDNLSMQLLGTRGASGPSVAGVLNRDDVPLSDLSSAARSGAGVTSSAGDLRLSGAGGIIRPGARGGLSDIGGSTSAQAATGAGVVTQVAGPKGDLSFGKVEAAGAPVSGVEQVVAKLRPKFKSCYQRGLSADPTMSGKVTILAKIGPNGEVSSTDVTSNQGLSAEVVACIQAAIKRAEFSPPGGGGSSSVSIPVSFVQQK